VLSFGFSKRRWWDWYVIIESGKGKGWVIKELENGVVSAWRKRRESKDSL
jgi:hypothetical protein